MTEYVKIEEIKEMPRIPLEGSLDLTYRCNNTCRHCWISIPEDSPEKEKELTFDEIREIVDDARKMGCRRWALSGGEPMLRPDFSDIFDTITRKSVSYSINTNGTLITPEIARLLKRKGSKMVALYGATAKVHDHITRNPGSFDLVIRGMSYLKEAGAGFIVQLIPMHDNFHQFKEMVTLAESLNPYWRIGAPWLYLSASGDPKRNQEIMRQRLDPKEVIALDKPDLSHEDWTEKEGVHNTCRPDEDGRLFAACIDTRRDFNIDPYGRMTFCCFIQDPALRYDVKKGNFEECWEEFIPSLSDKSIGGSEYKENCGSCELRNDCRWCPVYGYLEHRRFSARVSHLCDIAREEKRFKKDWQNNHRRFYQIAGITVQVDSDLPITDGTFHRKIKPFETDAPGEDIVKIRHHFFLPELNGRDLGREVYRRPPWAIYRRGNAWIYLSVSNDATDTEIHKVAVFNEDHTKVRIYNNTQAEKAYQKGSVDSLTLFPTDQILLARVLAARGGCYMHSCGIALDGKGFLFVGHSDAGKSTVARMLKNRAKILCDDRMIVRRLEQGFRIYGTWSHGDVPEVSPHSAPLKAILFLNQAPENKLEQIENRQEIIRKLLACLIKPLTTADWWEKMLTLVEDLSREVPCYNLHFDKSAKIVDLLDQLIAARRSGRRNSDLCKTAHTQ
ncbi:MAG: radical SAM protein [Pseudomonadota bacterium]